MFGGHNYALYIYCTSIEFSTWLVRTHPCAIQSARNKQATTSALRSDTDCVFWHWTVLLSRGSIARASFSVQNFELRCMHMYRTYTNSAASWGNGSVSPRVSPWSPWPFIRDRNFNTDSYSHLETGIRHVDFVIMDSPFCLIFLSYWDQLHALSPRQCIECHDFELTVTLTVIDCVCDVTV